MSAQRPPRGQVVVLDPEPIVTTHIVEPWTPEEMAEAEARELQRYIDRRVYAEWCPILGHWAMFEGAPDAPSSDRPTRYRAQRCEIGHLVKFYCSDSELQALKKRYGARKVRLFPFKEEGYPR